MAEQEGEHAPPWNRIDAHGGHVVEVHEPSLYSRWAGL
jgi:hypothetical protein